MPHLETRRDGHILTCTISNPPTHTLTARGVIELHQLLDEIEADDEIRVLVLTGGGEGVFIAHYEVGELAATASQQNETRQGEEKPAPAVSDDRPQLHPMHTLCLRLEALPAIVVAGINGNAAGGGCELTLACDFRLMADGDYRYGLPETSVGIIPGAGGTQRMARLLGNARALDLILHARLLTPSEALELGLVHRLLPEAGFRDEVHAFAEDLAGRAPLALSEAKRAIQLGSRLPLDEALAVEQQCFERTMRSEDAARAMKAFLEGDAYSWKGR